MARKFSLLYRTCDGATVKASEENFNKNIMEDHHKNNRLMLYRKRMKLSQKDVAAILGLRSAGVLSRYERGASLPPLERALALEIVYRVPVAFLFPEHYESMRTQLRNTESQLQLVKQPALF